MITIILPTYNEAENICELIRSLLYSIKHPVDILVVDDDSSDLTWKLVEDMNNPRVRVIRRINERGLASAIGRGLKESEGDIVGWMDADMCMPAEVVAQMADWVGAYDIAIGSRYVKGGRDCRGIFRVFTSRLINLFAGLLLGSDIKDYDSGFLLMKKEVLERVTFPASGYGDYFIEFVYKCKKAGFKIKEVPYVFRDRQKGRSKTAGSFFGFIRLGLGYIRRIVLLRFSS